MLKKSLIALMLSVACSVASIANAQLCQYLPKETVGKADGECYSLTAAETLSQTYTKVGAEQTRYTINLLSLTLHNPEMIDNYVCSYEGFTKNVYLPIIAASAKNEDAREILRCQDYFYDVAKHRFDFSFLMEGKKLVVRKGTANMFQGDVYATTYYKSKVPGDVPTRLTALMLIKALDYKLSRDNSEDTMQLHKPDKSFKVDWDFSEKLMNVTAYKDGQYYCSYNVPFSCDSIVMHKAGQVQWKYVAK